MFTPNSRRSSLRVRLGGMQVGNFGVPLTIGDSACSGVRHTGNPAIRACIFLSTYRLKAPRAKRLFTTRDASNSNPPTCPAIYGPASSIRRSDLRADP